MSVVSNSTGLARPFRRTRKTIEAPKPALFQPRPGFPGHLGCPDVCAAILARQFQPRPGIPGHLATHLIIAGGFTHMFQPRPDIPGPFAQPEALSAETRLPVSTPNET